MPGHYSEQHITHRQQIASILSRLQSERALISVRISQESNSSYNSILLSVDPQPGQFTLDELNPYKGHEKLREGNRVSLDARLKGVRVIFNSEIAQIEAGEIAMYRLPLPEHIIYHQRRRHHRARFDRKQAIPVSLPLPFRPRIQGELVDISASGVCSRIRYTDSAALEEQQSIQDATINLPGRDSFTCDLGVRSIRRFPDQGYSLVGSEFIGIPPAIQTHVARLVAMLDRHQRRTIHI